MPRRHVTLLVLLAAAAALVVGVNRTPLWDEDEPRFAVIARTMVETGDWVVPVFNGTLAVDKDVNKKQSPADAGRQLGCR